MTNAIKNAVALQSQRRRPFHGRRQSAGAVSDDGLLQIAGRRSDAHGRVDRGRVGIGRGSLADMQRAPVAAVERGGCAGDRAKRVANRGPAVVAAIGLDAGAKRAHRLVGQYRDEQVAVVYIPAKLVQSFLRSWYSDS